MTTPVEERPDLFTTAELFPLGRRFATEQPPPDEPGQAPFGATLAVTPQTISVDLTAIVYDPDRQISMIDEGGEWMPVMKHSTGNTTTNTVRDDARPGGDTDTDATED